MDTLQHHCCQINMIGNFDNTEYVPASEKKTAENSTNENDLRPNVYR